MLTFVGDMGGQELAPAGCDQHARTVPAVPRRSRRLDHRTLYPRDYLRDSHQFGVVPDAALRLPPGGDPRSLQVAFVQHELALRLRDSARTGVGPGASLGRRFGFSRQHWSRCLRGEAWMGATILAAAVSAVLRLPNPH